MRDSCRDENKNYAAVALTLAGFGILYNKFVDHLHQEGYERGITGPLVAFGVATSILIPYIVFGWRTYTLADLIIIFFADGTPMIAGAWKRFVEETREENRLILEEVEAYQKNNKTLIARIERERKQTT